jgi:hypothetical protein
MGAPVCSTSCGSSASGPPSAAAQLTRVTPQTIPGGLTPTTVDFTEVGFEVGSADADVVADEIIIGAAGIYEISYHLVWAPNGDTTLVTSTLTLNGVIPAQTAAFDPAVSFTNASAAALFTVFGTTMARLSVGDRIGLNVATQSVAERTLVAATLSLARVA